jgi:peptidoglycan/LPS O-acetylase OafA/YrhL
VVLAPVLLPASEPRLLRADAWATLFYVNNWQMVSGGGDYFAVAAAPSPFEHTWSLAIEEQFYLLWPLLLVVVLRRRHPRRLLALTCLAGATASGLALALLHDRLAPGRGYYGTDTRGASLLIGAALAVALSEPAVVEAIGRRPGSRRSLGALALAAGTAVTVACTRLTGEDAALYRGALGGLGVAVAVVLAYVVVVPDGLGTRLLSVPPLAFLGRISYGVYLWHWPVFLAVGSERSGLDGPTLFVVRCVLTVAVATASYLLVEHPIRSRAVLARPARAVPGAVAGLAGCAVLVAAATNGALDPGRRPEVGPTGPGGLADLSATAAPPPERSGHSAGERIRPAPHGGATAAEPVRHAHHRRPGRPVVVDVFGDSVAASLVEQLPRHPRLDLRDRSLVGCGVTLAAPYRYFGHTYPTVWPSCRPWIRLWRLAIDRDDPDVAFVLVGRWETMDRLLAGRWRHVGQAPFDAYLRNRLRMAIEIAGSHGARVVLATEPYNRRGEQPDGSIWPEDVPVRVEKWNDLLRSVAAATPGVKVAELGRLITPGTGFTWTAGGFMMRTDGVHLSPDGVRDRIAPWLFPRLLAWAPE